jgi:hypothetical protein
MHARVFQCTMRRNAVLLIKVFIFTNTRITPLQCFSGSGTWIAPQPAVRGVYRTGGAVSALCIHPAGDHTLRVGAVVSAVRDVQIVVGRT